MRREGGPALVQPNPGPPLARHNVPEKIMGNFMTHRQTERVLLHGRSLPFKVEQRPEIDYYYNYCESIGEIDILEI